MEERPDGEEADDVASGDAEEEVDGPVEGVGHHGLVPPAADGVPQAGQQEGKRHCGDYEGGARLPGEPAKVLQDRRVKGVEQKKNDETDVPPRSREDRSRLVLDRLQARQHHTRVRGGCHQGEEDEDQRPGVDEGGDVGRGDEEDAVDPADDDEEEPVNGKNRRDVTDPDSLLDQRVEEHEITDGGDCPVDNVEDGEEEDEVGEAHGPLGLAQHCHLLVPPRA